MNKDGLEWESLLRSDAPSGAMLKAALLTTYDRPDDVLLVEHLLPLLLKLDHEPRSDGKEQQYFRLELDARLKQLHGRITVVSSTLSNESAEEIGSEFGAHEHDANEAYPWIWRSIRHLTVGSQDEAVQHAKLWLFHWGSSEDGDSEYLEIVVSSTNLTRSAFKGQLQAAWRACIELERRPSQARLAGWGLLPEFMRTVAESTGHAANLDRYLDLLARAECPPRVSFLASVPGTHSAKDLRRTPWGAAGLQNITPPGRGATSASILSPYVGSWDIESLQGWCARFGGRPDRLNLVWIDRAHPWARAWMLPEATLTMLMRAEARLLHLRHAPNDDRYTDRFHAKHRAADHRWSHAKLYALRRGNSRRLLLTSANFSPSAWGRIGTNGELRISNFELGVCIEQVSWPFDELAPFTSLDEIAITVASPARVATMIQWAAAAWNGETIAINCRCVIGLSLDGQVYCGGVWVPVATWKCVDPGRNLFHASVPWSDGVSPPSIVRLACEGQAITVPVFDERTGVERETSLPEGIDAEIADMLRDALLFEHYGGLAADDLDDDQELESKELANEEMELEDREFPSGGNSDSYAVAAFVLTRRHLRVVDNWALRMRRVASGPARSFERQIVRRDGELLVAAFKRQAMRDSAQGNANALGASMAAEELGIRLKQIVEEA